MEKKSNSKRNRNNSVAPYNYIKENLVFAPYSLVLISKVHIFTLLLSVCTVDKSKVKISQIFEAFSDTPPLWTDLVENFPLLKFAYSEKATKFCEISTLLLSVCTVDKSKVEISQNFVAFSEYMNFNK